MPRTSLLALLITCASFSGSAEGATLLGVLEEPQCKVNAGTLARVMFAKKDQAWIPLVDEKVARGYIAAEISWTIALDGRSEGGLRTKDPGFITPNAWAYARDRLLNRVPGAALPHFANKAQRFSGWCGAPKNRPLVLVSGGGVSDPDRWKPVQLQDKDLGLLFNSFKAQVGPALRCSNHSEKGVPFEYAVKDLEVLWSYGDKAGRRLITARLKRLKDTDTCDGFYEQEWDAHTFLLTPKVDLGPGLDLVDAGDYDNDGHSEALFSFSGYNRDGYVLFSNRFATKAEFLWSYH